MPQAARPSASSAGRGEGAPRHGGAPRGREGAALPARGEAPPQALLHQGPHGGPLARGQLPGHLQERICYLDGRLHMGTHITISISMSNRRIIAVYTKGPAPRRVGRSAHPHGGSNKAHKHYGRRGNPRRPVAAGGRGGATPGAVAP